MVVLVTSKILSPQYLFWVVPFVALLSRPKTLVFWAACLLTTVGYPLNFGPMLNQDPLDHPRHQHPQRHPGRLLLVLGVSAPDSDARDSRPRTAQGAFESR